MQRLLALSGFLLVFLADRGTAQPARIPAGQDPPPLPAKGSARVFITPLSLPEDSLKGLCDASDAIVEGTVDMVLAARTPSPRNVETDSVISVLRVLKGPVALKKVTISQTGGTVGGFVFEPQSYSMMRPSEHYLLFLRSDARPTTPRSANAPPYIVTSSWLGLFPVINGRIRLGPQHPDGIRSPNTGATIETVEAAVSAIVGKR